MRLAGFRIRNFKCFKDTGWHTLAANRSVVVGENSSGKTALLSALSPKFTNQPCRAETNQHGAELDPESIVDIRFTAEGAEFEAIILRAGNSLFMPMEAPPAADSSLRSAWRNLTKQGQIEFEVQRNGGGPIVMARRPSFSLFSLPEGATLSGTYVNPDRRKQTVTFQGYQSVTDDMGISLAHTLVGETFIFGAQRALNDRHAVGVRISSSSPRTRQKLSQRANQKKY
ncbi:MAG: hypothetical protein HOP13_04120 [Alphaproteobacteria bacterium]|nr:hypothetical protein [Alphaproteobacteria bacterium]